MGREIKRVPLNFAWPKDKAWEGYLNPHYKGHCSDCRWCGGSGASPEARHLKEVWYGNAPFCPLLNGSKPYLPDDPIIQKRVRGDGMEARRLCEIFNASWSHHLSQEDVDALLAAERLWDFTRAARTDRQKELVKRRMATGKHNSWLPYSNRYRPTAKEVNDWSLFGLAHDSCNQWIVVKARCLGNKWPTECAVCKGEGSSWDSQQNKLKAARWRRKEPPKGVGYQLWETVSEGSAISPVFATPEELAKWLVESPDYKWRRNDDGTTYDQWLGFIRGPGWAPSLIGTSRGVVTGVQATCGVVEHTNEVR